MDMSDLEPTYRAEYARLKKANDKLEADVRLLAATHDTDTIRKEIQANERRMHTLECVMRWIREHGLD